MGLGHTGGKFLMLLTYDMIDFLSAALHFGKWRELAHCAPVRPDPRHAAAGTLQTHDGKTYKINRRCQSGPGGRLLKTQSRHGFAAGGLAAHLRTHRPFFGPSWLSSALHCASSLAVCVAGVGWGGKI